MKVYRMIDGVKTALCDIMEATYTGKDMGERSIKATVKLPEVINFEIGDFVELSMQSLLRGDESYAGNIMTERFYVYTMPSIKKTARKDSAGDAFEINVEFKPRQYELGLIQMRDLLQKDASGMDIIYTGFDQLTFYGGASSLMRHVKAVLDAYYDELGDGTVWNYHLADEVNEEINTALESFMFTFNGNTIMDAILKLNDPEGINTTFFINGTDIYIGYKRPYMCRMMESEAGDISISDRPLELAYGKTSHLPVDNAKGGLFDITKTIGKESPITKLFAYGGSRNLNRYYDADAIHVGRYVNRLMLPSFSHDGRTDYIKASDEKIAKYGIREGSKQFEEIYPSLENVRYQYIRGVRYCIKIKYNGRDWSKENYPIQRIQCYKIVPSQSNPGVNVLQEAYPEEPLAIYIHGYQDGNTARGGKVIRCVLYPSYAEQYAADFGYVPVDNDNNVIPGSCYAVHDRGFDEPGTEYKCNSRREWFQYNPEPKTEKEVEAMMHQLQYYDTFWATELHIFKGYDSNIYEKGEYSLYCWSRINEAYNKGNNDNSLFVNELVGVRPITTADRVDGYDNEQVFDVYLRDVGFKIDEQTDNGEPMFLQSGDITVHFRTGNLQGHEFKCKASVDAQDSVVCAYMEDGTINDEFFKSDFSNTEEDRYAQEAFEEGAIWRMRLIRDTTDEDHPDFWIPNMYLNASAGDRIVLLNICMPDIYIRAAEYKLEQEAYKYLDKNSKDSTTYSVTFDKVRFQQIPMYALQMREGLNLRITDEDLGAYMENNERNLREGKEELKTGSSLQRQYYTTQYYNVEVESQYRFIHDAEHKSQWLISKNDEMMTARIKMPMTEGKVGLNGHMYIRVIRHVSSSENFRNSHLADIGLSTVEEVDGYYEFDIKFLSYSSYEYIILGTDYRSYYEYAILEFCVPELEQHEKEVGHNYYFSGHFNSDAPELISFKAGKYYEVVMKLRNELFKDVYGTDDGSHFMITDQIGYNKTSWFIPEYVAEEIADDGFRTTYKFKFYLPENFNDSRDYCVSVLYYADGTEWYEDNILVSIIERDFEEVDKFLPYKDFVADEVTVKIEDNTRDEDNRLVNFLPEPIKEISANISEKSQGSAWATLNNKIEDLENESNATISSIESKAKSARMTAFDLIALRNHIFDPDASLDRYEKCSPDFLRKMMLQIGADSMNFQMDKTYQGADGTQYNYEVVRDPRGFDVFNVLSDDRLRHFVFNREDGQSLWNIPAASFYLEQVEGEYPVYYISLKCSTTDDSGVWYCSPTMKATNADSGYYHFNWGILTPSSDGYYHLQETRGNAYMYGDNLIVGRISDMSKHSYFDLNKGEFVLADNYGEMLSFKNGILKLFGMESSTEIGAGAILTDILQVRNNGVVTAGINGKLVDGDPSKTPVWWAGGTFDQAKAGNTNIVQYLDGTGKYGVFKIGSDKVSVIGPNGTIIIDDNEGISMLNGDAEKIKITPKSVANEMPEPSYDEYAYVPRTTSYVGSYDGSETRVCEFTLAKEASVSIKNINIVLANCKCIHAGLSTLYAHDISMKLVMYKQGGIKVHEFETISGQRTSDTEEVTMYYQPTSYPDPIVLQAGLYYFGLVIYITDDSTNYTTFSAVDSGVMNNSYVYARVIPSYIAKTIIGNDGIASVYNSDVFFKVLNTQDGQEIYAQGLNNSSDNPGELIKKDVGFRDFALRLKDFMHNYFKETAKEGGFSDALQALIDTLPQNDKFITSI